MPNATMSTHYKNVEWLHEHYVVRKLSIREVAREAGAARNTIWCWLHRLGISVRRCGGVTGNGGGRGRMGWEAKKTQKSSIRPKITDIAWAAGFIEGEGHMRSRGCRSSEITVSQLTKEPILKLQKLFGGHVSQQNSFHPKDRATKLKSLWVWRASGSRARGVIMTLYFFLSGWRRSQALLAMREM